MHLVFLNFIKDKNFHLRKTISHLKEVSNKIIPFLSLKWWWHLTTQTSLLSLGILNEILWIRSSHIDSIKIIFLTTYKEMWVTLQDSHWMSLSLIVFSHATMCILCLFWCLSTLPLSIISVKILILTVQIILHENCTLLLFIYILRPKGIVLIMLTLGIPQRTLITSFMAPWHLLNFNHTIPRSNCRMSPFSVPLVPVLADALFPAVPVVTVLSPAFVPVGRHIH